MDSEGIIQYFKMMAPSILIMLLIAYGMAVENPLIQYGAIGLILVVQLGYQTIRSIRSAPMLESNMRDATKAKSGRLLLTATENEITEIKKQVKDTGVMGMSSKTLLILFVPLIIFYASSQIIGVLAPSMPQWQSYLIGFILSIPVSTIVAMKSGVSTVAGPAASPNAYYVSEKGIVFEHMGRTFISPFPIRKLNVNKGKMYIEVEGQSTKSIMIPSKVKLFSQDVDKLQRLLSRFIETKSETKQ